MLVFPLMGSKIPPRTGLFLLLIKVLNFYFQTFLYSTQKNPLTSLNPAFKPNVCILLQINHKQAKGGPITPHTFKKRSRVSEHLSATKIGEITYIDVIHKGTYSNTI